VTDDAPRTQRLTGELIVPDRLSVQEAHLVVLDGELAGKEIPCGAVPIRIGSALDGQLVLKGDPSVSRRHAIVETTQGGLLVRDLGSTNGTFVDDVRVKEAYLQPGCVVRVGLTRMRLEVLQRKEAVPASQDPRFGHLVGKSPKMRQLFTLLSWVAPTEATVLISGPTGTGKELVARSIHEASPRKEGPYVVLDCGSLDPQLISSELFGHEPGSFTGATARRIGVFEQARGGTLFIDEVGELPVDLQPKFLRVLESREVKRLGSNQPVPVDVRIVAATNRQLDQMVLKGAFREDLYYRLCQVQVALPPLDERREDLPLLVEALLARMSGSGAAHRIAPDALEFLVAGSFPGNVRQLRNIVERAAMIAQGPSIELQHLMVFGAELRPLTGAGASVEPGADEKARILAALKTNGNVLVHTAKDLGIAINTLKARMRRHGIPLPRETGRNSIPGQGPSQE